MKLVVNRCRDYIGHQMWDDPMREIQLREAKATLSRIVDGTSKGETFAITRHGRREAVIVSWDAWQRLTTIPSFVRLLAASPIEPGDIPERDPTPGRDAEL